MMKHFYLLALVFSSILFFNNTLHAQCCAAGSPNSDNSFSPNGSKNILAISVTFTHSLSDDYFKADSYLSDYQYLRSFYNFSSLQVSYGINSRLTVTSDLGYFYSKTQEFPSSINFPNGYKRKAFGLADATLSFSYKLLDNKKRKLNFLPLAKITIPVGKFDQMFGPVVLPVDLQPSSGNFKFLGGFMLTKQFSKKPISIGNISSLEYSNWIKTDRTVYKYGNLYNASFFGMYSFKNKISLKGIMRYQYRERATNEDKKLISASGGSLFFASLDVGYLLFQTWKINALIEIPFYKYMNGTQLTQKYLYTLTVSKAINLNSKIDNKEQTTIASTKVKVYGACEMCKARIEKVALNFPNVVYCNYDLKTQKLTLGYNSAIDTIALEKALAAIGHDTNNFKAADEVYNALPACCHYRK